MKPQRNQVQFTLRLPDKLNETITQQAKAKGITKNSLIILKLWELAKEN